MVSPDTVGTGEQEVHFNDVKFPLMPKGDPFDWENKHQERGALMRMILRPRASI